MGPSTTIDLMFFVIHIGTVHVNSDRLSEMMLALLGLGVWFVTVGFVRFSYSVMIHKLWCNWHLTFWYGSVKTLGSGQTRVPNV